MRFLVLGLLGLVVVGFVVATLIGVAIQIAFWVAIAAAGFIVAGWVMRKLGGDKSRRDHDVVVVTTRDGEHVVR